MNEKMKLNLLALSAVIGIVLLNIGAFYGMLLELPGFSYALWQITFAISVVGLPFFIVAIAFLSIPTKELVNEHPNIKSR